jgi:AraC-like DNA-binding protein
MVTVKKDITKNIQQYHFKEGLTQEFEIIDIQDLYSKNREQLITPHRTGFYHIVWFEEGNGTQYIDFTPISTSPGSLLFIHKDMVKQFDVKPSFRGKIILFTDAFFSTQQHHLSYLNTSVLFNDFFKVAHLQIQHDNLSPIASIFSQLEIEFKHSYDEYKPIILQNLLHNLMLYSERIYRIFHLQEIKKGNALTILIQFKDILENHYQQHKKVSFYAEKLHLTEKKLAKCTFETIGKSAKEMIQDRTILEAKRLLAHTHLSIKEIGFELGFDEPTNFVKYFKNSENQIPTVFRELYQKG